MDRLWFCLHLALVVAGLFLCFVNRWLAATCFGLAIARLVYDKIQVGRRRELCRASIINREDGNLAAEFDAVCSRYGMSLADVRRLWMGIAGFWKVPAVKLRASDRLQVELGDLIGDYDHDIWLNSLIIGFKGPAREMANTLCTTSEADVATMIRVFAEYEKNQGKLMVQEIVSEAGQAEYVWTS